MNEEIEKVLEDAGVEPGVTQADARARLLEAGGEEVDDLIVLPGRLPRRFKALAGGSGWLCEQVVMFGGRAHGNTLAYKLTRDGLNAEAVPERINRAQQAQTQVLAAKVLEDAGIDPYGPDYAAEAADGPKATEETRDAAFTLGSLGYLLAWPDAYVVDFAHKHLHRNEFQPQPEE